MDRILQRVGCNVRTERHLLHRSVVLASNADRTSAQGVEVNLGSIATVFAKAM